METCDQGRHMKKNKTEQSFSSNGDVLLTVENV